MPKELMNQNLEQKKDGEWDESTGLMTKISANGGFAGHVKKNEAFLKDIFPKELSCVCCMDGRITVGGARAAGGGLRLSAEEKKSFIQKLRAAGVRKVMRHSDCGAEALFIKERMQQKVFREDAEKEVKDWFQYLALQLGGNGVGWVPVSPEFHNERVIYYDVTGTFDPAAAVSKVLPVGFVISRKYLEAESAVRDVNLGIAIATGEHGYGDRFDKKNPLTIVIVANNNEELTAARSELTACISEKVTIDGFVKP